MASVAEQLRRGRDAAGLTVNQAAEATKMRTDHVRALEEGNYNVFVAAVYIRGFVRSYARLLKIDEAAVLTELESELSRSEKFREHPGLSPHGGWLDTVTLLLSRLHWRIVVPVLVVVLALLAALAVNRSLQAQHARNPLEGIHPTLAQPAPAAGGELLPLPAPPKPSA